MSGRAAALGRGGRGAFYRYKYGSRKPETRDFSSRPEAAVVRGSSPPRSPGSRDWHARGKQALLERELLRLDGAQYGAYRDIKGVWDMSSFLVSMDRIQADPYAPPSKARVRVPQSIAQFPTSLFSNKVRTIALADYITRKVHNIIKQRKFDGHGEESQRRPGSGSFRIDVPGQQVLQRNSVLVNADWVEARISIDLPARGRTILGKKASEILSNALYSVVENAMIFSEYDSRDVEAFVASIEDQDFLRRTIVEQGYTCLVPNGAILPRESGASDKPLQGKYVVPFQSPPSLEKTFELPNHGSITGMAIPQGITTIVGGGFHGKSTLLEAISLGVWNHIPGDGREFTVTDPTAVGVRSEDGRNVSMVDISPFINNIPGGGNTRQWSSKDASGSTSMAANVVEACELGSRLLLFDEDLCATNFMVRDEVMRQIVPSEPITPLIERVVSHLINADGRYKDSIGGRSDYLIANVVLLMDNYKPMYFRDVTAKAHSLVHIPSYITSSPHFQPRRDRSILPTSIHDPLDKHPKPRSLTRIQLGDTSELDLSALSQLVHQSQTRFIAEAVVLLAEATVPTTVKETVDFFIAGRGERMLREDATKEGWLAGIRPIDLGMALNRIREIKVSFRQSD